MNRVLKNFFSTSVANIIGQLIGFLCITYYTGILMKHNYGMITYAQQYVLYFTTIVLFGIQTVGTKLVVQKDKSYDDLVSELSSFRLIIATIGFIVCTLLSFFISADRRFPPILIIWSLIYIPTAYNFDWFFAGIQDMKHNAVYNLFKTVVPAIIIFIFVRQKTDIYIVPTAMVIGVLLGAIYYLIILKMKNIKVKIKINKELFKKYFFMGLPFLLSGLLSMVNGNIDKVILGSNALEYSNLGIYQAAYNFVNFIVTFIGVIFLTLFPYIVKSHSEGPEKIKSTLKVVMEIVLAMAIPISIGGFLLADKIIGFFYTSEFTKAAVPFRILMFYIFIFSIREVYAYSLNAFGLEKKYLKIVAVSASLNFIFNMILIPKYSYLAAAYITGITEIVNFIYMRKNIRKIAKFNDFKVVIKILIPSLIMGAFIVVSRNYINNLFIIIILAMIVYAVQLLIFKVLNIKEIKNELQ